METKDMSKDERSLLLYLETCIVDYGGQIESRRMNEIDFKNMTKFKVIGLIDYGRLTAEFIISTEGTTHRPTHWVRFSEEAWRLAHELRRERAERLMKSPMAQRGMRE